MRQHAAERIGKRDALGGKRAEIGVARKARTRFLGRDDFEELLLPRRAADRGNKVLLGCLLRLRARTVAHAQGLITTSAPGGYPSLSGGIKIQPSACASADSGR